MPPEPFRTAAARPRAVLPRTGIKQVVKAAKKTIDRERLWI